MGAIRRQHFERDGAPAADARRQPITSMRPKSLLVRVVITRAVEQ
jgi:hypothetical protein